jgi:ferredoxin
VPALHRGQVRPGCVTAPEQPETVKPERTDDVPQLTVEGYGTVEVPQDKRLVLAIEQDAKVDVLHACGGNARCTTCRVEFIAGEPPQMTQAEESKLRERGLTGVRLSCQILCDHDMTVRAISRLEGSGRADAGPTPAPEITPPAVWGTV